MTLGAAACQHDRGQNRFRGRRAGDEEGVVAVERHKAKEVASEATAATEVEVGIASRGWPTAAEAAAERAAEAVGKADEVEAAARLKAHREVVGRP